MESSWRDLFIDMIVDRFIFKYNLEKLFPVSLPYLKQGCDYLK